MTRSGRGSCFRGQSAGLSAPSLLFQVLREIFIPVTSANSKLISSAIASLSCSS